MITQAVKLSVKQSSGEKHKRTRQGVSAKLESYIYRVHLVHTTTLCPLHFLLKTIMLYTCALMSSSRFFYHVLGLWHHIMWHVMWLQCHMPLHWPKEKKNKTKQNWQSHKTDHKTWENGVEGSGIKWRHTTWTTHVGLMSYTWSFRVGYTVVSMDHG